MLTAVLILVLEADRLSGIVGANDTSRLTAMLPSSNTNRNSEAAVCPILWAYLPNSLPKRVVLWIMNPASQIWLPLIS